MYSFLKKTAMSLALIAVTGILPVFAEAPPVRIAIVPAGGSGIEQDAIDQISNQLQNDPNVVVSTVNPDWYVVCNIQERIDQASGSIRYNGTVTIKTTDGQIINNIAVQKYNQDFSVTPGAAPNKFLVDSAARDVVSGMADRAVGPIQQAVVTEMDTRNKVDAAMQLAEQGKYDAAISALQQVSANSTHLNQARSMAGQLQIEKKSLSLVAAAAGQAKHGRLSEAIATLRQVDKHSRCYPMVQAKIEHYKGELAQANALARSKAAAAAAASSASKPAAKPAEQPAQAELPSQPADQMDSLERARKALQMQEQAIEAKQSALQMQQAVQGQGKGKKGN